MVSSGDPDASIEMEKVYCIMIVYGIKLKHDMLVYYM